MDQLNLEFLDKCRELCEKMPALTDPDGRFYIDLPSDATPEAIKMFEANGFKVISKPVPQGYRHL